MYKTMVTFWYSQLAMEPTLFWCMYFFSFSSYIGPPTLNTCSSSTSSYKLFKLKWARPLLVHIYSIYIGSWKCKLCYYSMIGHPGKNFMKVLEESNFLKYRKCNEAVICHIRAVPDGNSGPHPKMSPCPLPVWVWVSFKMRTLRTEDVKQNLSSLCRNVGMHLALSLRQLHLLNYSTFWVICVQLRNYFSYLLLLSVLIFIQLNIPGSDVEPRRH